YSRHVHTPSASPCVINRTCRLLLSGSFVNPGEKVQTRPFTVLTSPTQFGSRIRIPLSSAIFFSLSCFFNPSSPTSEYPEANRMTDFTLLFAQSFRHSSALSALTQQTAKSICFDTDANES